jgi:hypothetical protein
MLVNYYQSAKLLHRIRTCLLLFIIALVLSGLTALGVETQMHYLSPLFPAESTSMGGWLWKAYRAVAATNQRYPFIAYDFDWLAFAHIVIATVFIGPLQDPVRNKWVVQFGCIACCMVVPFALVAGGFRGLPLWWRFIDCSFGIIGLVPISLCLRYIRRLQALQAVNPNTIFSSTVSNKYNYEPTHSHA